MSNLIGFQKDLHVALDEHKAKATLISSFVGVADGEHHWLIDVDDLLETETPPPIARVGHAMHGITGIASFRGKVLTLIDMQYQLRRIPLIAPENGWATAVHPKYETSVALLWPSMLGLLSRDDFKPVSANNVHSVPWVKGKFQDSRGSMWWHFDMLAWWNDMQANLLG